MNLIVEMQFGSHLYGTATAASDRDFKAVYIPSARDILLQRVQPVVSITRDKLPGEKNLPGDIDREAYSLQRYLELLGEGQMVAIDMLFAPDSAMTRIPSPVWRKITASTDRLLTRKSSGFLRYCQQQAHKYGIKGSRVAAARQALDLLLALEARYGSAAKLAVAEVEIAALVASTEHMTLRDVAGPGPYPIRHWEVSGRKAPFTSSIKSAREVMEHLVAAYGERARQAERNDGIDWKALSHAVRVGRQGIDVLINGRVQFPLPYAPHLLAIKRGELPYQQVREEIEQLLVDVEAAADRSSLPMELDQSFIDDLVSRAYFEQVKREFGDDR